jgi:predicted MPP superfamily phosphohydrolase
LAWLFGLALALCARDAGLIEPRWVKITRLTLTPQPSVRLIQISDLQDVTSGLGMLSPPLRFLCRPEIVVIEL